MNKLTIALASAASLAIVACAEEPAENVAYEDAATADQMANAEAETGTVVEVAQGDETFSTLVSAVTAADLGATLSGDGPFTVFAPTNAAFDALPDGTLETLTTEDTDQLGSILTYHVVGGQLDPEAVVGKQETLQGGTVNVKGDTDGMTVNGANILCGNIPTANATVYVIDTVLMPS